MHVKTDFFGKLKTDCRCIELYSFYHAERGMNDACIRRNKRIIKLLLKEAYDHYNMDICTVYANMRGQTKIIELYLTEGTFDKSKIHWMCQECLCRRKPFIKSTRDVVGTLEHCDCNFHL